MFYGPSKPHFGHRYGRPNFRHLASRQIRISPQFGHGNLVDSFPGGIILWQDVHTGTAAVGFSVMITVDSLKDSRIVEWSHLYVLC